VNEKIAISSGFAVLAPDESKQLLTAMVQQASSAFKISEIKGKIEALPKPASGDRKTSRKLNEQGLAALKVEDFSQAIATFKNATVSDPADVEVLNNYVFALIKGGRLQDAESEAGRLLTMSPGRSSAWANLAEVYALKNKKDEAVAALVLAFQFSSNKDRTINFFNERAADPSSPLQPAAKRAIDVIQKM
jgi:predicted Zn-dependent protease